MAAKGGKKGEAVMVVVRMRPFNSKEKSENRGPCIDMDIQASQVFITNPARRDLPPKGFTFDGVFNETTQQKFFYEESCYSLVESVMDGFNGTIFAYGQTGCGKTWTMQGLNEPELRGVIPNSFEHIFQTIKSDPETQFLVRCSYLEIYNEEIRDLLGSDTNKKLDLKEDPSRGVFVKDLREEVVKDEQEINVVMDRGFQNRTVGATLMNAGSSRSHSIFTVIIEANQQVDGKDKLHAGKLNLVDLAGSERQSKTGATGDRLKEGCKINLSLSALGNVISALVDGKGKHIPYRDSKLTRLLQDSLGGNTKTLMVAAISPADYNYDETLSTLRYANRAKNIQNKPKINEDPKDAMLREYKEEIERLRKLLEDQAKHMAVGSPASIMVAQAEARRVSDVRRASEMAGPEEVGASGGTAPLPPGMGGEDIAVGGGGGPPGMDASGGLPPGMAGSPRVVQLEVEKVVEVEKEVEKLVQVEKVVEVEKVVQVEKEVEKVIEVEKLVPVTSKEVADQRKAMEDYNQSIVEQRNQMGERLEAKDGEVKEAINQQQALVAKLQALRAKVMGGLGISEAPFGVKDDEDLDVEIARKERERRRMQAKLRAKKRKERQLEAERQQAEMERKEAEEELKSAKEQAESAERKQAKYKKRMEKKLLHARQEAEDLTSEFQREKNDLLETIREQNRELKLFEQVVELLLPVKEISKIWERSKWNPEGEEWELPTIKPRKEYQGLPSAGLPSLSGGGGDEGSFEAAEEKARRRRHKHKSKGEGDEGSRGSRDGRGEEEGRRSASRRRHEGEEGSGRPSTASRHRRHKDGEGGGGAEGRDGGRPSTASRRRHRQEEDGEGNSRPSTASRRRARDAQDQGGGPTAGANGQAVGMLQDWGFAGSVEVGRIQPKDDFGDRVVSRQGSRQGFRQQHQEPPSGPSPWGESMPQTGDAEGSRSRPSSGRSVGSNKPSKPPRAPSRPEGGSSSSDEKKKRDGARSASRHRKQHVPPSTGSSQGVEAH